MAGNVVDRGLEGVVVGETVLSNVEGQVGRLTYRGYDIHDLAVNATFEEVVHLLLYGELPTQAQLATSTPSSPLRALPPTLITAQGDSRTSAWPMDVLRTGGLGARALRRRTIPPRARTPATPTPRST